MSTVFDDAIEAHKEVLLRSAHNNFVTNAEKLGGMLHRQKDCDHRSRSSDPPFCPNCTPWLRPWEELDFKIKDEIWEAYSYILDPALKGYTDLIGKIQNFLTMTTL